MWRYKQPGFALLLLSELQKQQQSGLHCDTLLQTEGVSVPVHSSVLSALSPVFSRALSNSSSLPVGQSRLLKLQGVGAHALVKLVGFLYSGEIEGEGLDEQEEVVKIAHRLGFSNLIDGLKRQMNGEQNKAIKLQEIGLHTENKEEKKKGENLQILSERESFTHSENRTDNDRSHFADVFPALVPSEYSTSTSLEKISDISASNVSKVSVPVHSESCQKIQKKNKKEKNTKKKDQLRETSLRKNNNFEGARSEILNSAVFETVKGVGGKDFRKLVKQLGFRSRTAFEQQEDTHISLKIKLKRRKRGALWEIVSVQEENIADGSRARSNAATGKTDSHTEPQRNGTEVNLSFFPEFSRLGPLTPPSDLTLSPPASPTMPDPCTPDSNPPSSLLQNPSGLPQAEESDEQIEKLLEDMVMMGLHILPSVSIDGNSDMNHLSEQPTSPETHLEPELGQCKAVNAGTASCHNLWTGGFDIGNMPCSAGSSGQGEAGSECPGARNRSRSGKMELKNLSSFSSHPPSFSIPAHCAASQKDVDLLSTAPEKVLMSNLPFSTGGLELPHQNVGQLKNVLDNVFLNTDDNVHSGQQTKNNINSSSSETDTSCAAHDALDSVNTVIQTSSEIASSLKEKQCPRPPSKYSPNVTKQALSCGTSDFVHAISSKDGTDLNEMRLPRCLSPLALKVGKTVNPLNPLGMSLSHSESSVNLKSTLKTVIISPDPQALSGQQDSSNTYAKAALSNNNSEIISDSFHSSSNRDDVTESRDRLGQIMTQNQSFDDQILEGAKDNSLETQIDQSGIKRMSSKRLSVGVIPNEPNSKKHKTKTKGLTGDTQPTNKTPCSEIGDAAAGISTAQCSVYPCSKKVYFLRTGKTVKSTSADQRFSKKLKHVQTNQSFKSKDQKEYTEKVDKIPPAPVVVKRARGRPHKKRKCPPDFLPNLNKEKTSTCAGKDDLQLTQSKTKSKFQEHDLVKNKEHVLHGSSPKENRHAVDIAQTINTLNDCDEPSTIVSTYIGHQGVQKAESKVNSGCEENMAQNRKRRNVSVESEELIAGVNSNKEENKQPNRIASQTKRKSVVDLVFHQTIFSVGTSSSVHLPPLDQKLRSNIWNTQNSETTQGKGSAGPPPPHIVRKFINLTERVCTKKRKKDTVGKGKTEPRVKVNDKDEEVTDKSKDQKTKTRPCSKRIKVSKNQNACVDVSETEMCRNQTNKISETSVTSIHTDLPCLNAQVSSQNIPLTRNVGSNSEMENDVQSEPAKISVDTEVTQDRIEDFQLKENVEAPVILTEMTEVEKEKKNRETEAVHVTEIPRTNKSHGAEIRNVEVEIMEGNSPFTSSHGDEATTFGWTTDKMDIEENLFSVIKTNGEPVLYDAELVGRQFLRTRMEIMPSDEALLHTDLPATKAKFASPNQHHEELEQTHDRSAPTSLLIVPSVSMNIEVEGQECDEDEDEDEEVVVDDISSSFVFVPHFSLVSESVTVQTEEEDEEEDVDVTGEDTD